MQTKLEEKKELRKGKKRKKNTILSQFYFYLFLVHQVTEVLSDIIIQITFKMSSKCLFPSRQRRHHREIIIVSAGIVNPHIIVEKIAWNVLMAVTIAAKVA